MAAYPPSTVEHPAHYAHFSIEPLTFITANGLGFCEGNVIKYICRYKHKNGVEDLKKACTYLEALIAKEESIHAPA